MAKVCLICVSLRAGGTEKVVSVVANSFVRRHDVAVVLLSSHPQFYVLDPRVELVRFCGKGTGLRRKLYWLRLARFLRRTLLSKKPDVVLSFGEKISPLVALTTIGLRLRVIILNRGSPLRSIRGSQGVLNPLVYPLADRVVVQTEESLHILRNRYRFSKFTVLPNPVVIPSITVPMSRRRKVVLNVGSIGRLKNQAFLVRAFAGCASKANWELHFIGDGPDRPHLEESVRLLGLGDRVKFLGEKDNVSENLATAQVFAFTSLSEGFPNALAEALAHGCACISFNCLTGPSELIQGEVNGLLVPIDDEIQYQEQLERLLHDEQLRIRLSTQALSHIQRFSSERILDGFERLVTAQDD